MSDEDQFKVELKQTTRGQWYAGTVKLSAATITELDTLINIAVPYLQDKIETINGGGIKREAVKKETAPEIILSPEEGALFEKLRGMRIDLAKAEDIPPYMVFHDSVLKQFAKYKPMTKEEMLRLQGVGEHNFGKYGVYFLKVIRSSVPTLS